MALLPSAVNDAVPLTDGPGVMVMSSQVAPASVEYCCFVTATSSVAVTLSTVGAAWVNQPLLPVDVDGAAGGLPLRCGAAVGVNVPTFNTGAVVSGPCADADGTTASAAPTAAAVARMRCTLSPLLGKQTLYKF